MIACIVLMLVVALFLANCKDNATRSAAAQVIRTFNATDFSFVGNEAEEVNQHPQPQRRTLTPLQKKRVAAANAWRCQKCGSLVDETFEKIGRAHV